MIKQLLSLSIVLIFVACASQPRIESDKDSEYDLSAYKSFKIEGNAILIEFDHIGSGLMAKGGTGIHGFAIAGKDGDYVWADAKIITRAQDAKQLIKVSNKLIPEPKSVR